MGGTRGNDDGPKPDEQGPSKSASSNDDSDFEETKETSELVEKQVDTEKTSPYFIWRLTKCLKTTYLVLLFVLVLGTGCLSRVLIHVMIWNLSPPDTNNRNLKLVSIFGYLQPDVDVIIRNSSCEDMSCSKGLPLTWTCTDIDNQTCTLAEDVPTTNVAWIWAVMLTISAPYVYTFLTNLSRYCTKKTHKINRRIILVGIIRDTIHSITLCLLVFFVLPTIAPDMAAVTVYIVTCFPVFLNINLIRLHPSKQDKLSPYLSPGLAAFFFVPSIGTFVAVITRSTCWNYKLMTKTLFACVLVSLEWFESFIILTSKRVVIKKDNLGKRRASICEIENCNPDSRTKDQPHKAKSDKDETKGKECGTLCEKDKTKDVECKTESQEHKTESDKGETKGKECGTVCEKDKTKDGECKTESEEHKTESIKDETQGKECGTLCEKDKTKDVEGKTESQEYKTKSDKGETKGKECGTVCEKDKTKDVKCKTASQKDETESQGARTEAKTECIDICFKSVILYAACRKERENCVLALIKLVTLNLVFLPLIMGFMTDWMNILEFSSDVVYGCNSSTPFIVMIICVCSTFVFFKLAQHACRIQYQLTHFVIPIFLNLIITPIVIAVIQQNNLIFIFSDCSVLQPLLKTVLDILSPDPWLLRISEVTGVLSIVCLTLNLCCEEAPISLQKAIKLFSKAAYCGIYPDASLLLSRKLDEELTKMKVVSKSDGNCENIQNNNSQVGPKHRNDLALCLEKCCCLFDMKVDSKSDGNGENNQKSSTNNLDLNKKDRSACPSARDSSISSSGTVNSQSNNNSQMKVVSKSDGNGENNQNNNSQVVSKSDGNGKNNQKSSTNNLDLNKKDRSACPNAPDSSISSSGTGNSQSNNNSQVAPTSDGNGVNNNPSNKQNAPTRKDKNSGSNNALKVEPIIIACATMWHEELEEMCKLVASVLRLGVASKEKQYGFEAHIFFDDAFTDDEIGGRVLNKYAENLYEAIDKSMRLIYDQEKRCIASEKVTEYGWRITWDIKGKNAKDTLKGKIDKEKNEKKDQSKDGIKCKVCCKGGQESVDAQIQKADEQKQNNKGQDQIDKEKSKKKKDKPTDGNESKGCFYFTSCCYGKIQNKSNKENGQVSDEAQKQKANEQSQDKGGQNQIDEEKTELFVHFKDKEKIRVKKRWSQVMYMHYLLTKRFRPRIVNKEQGLAQTFILALDGDVDFQPEAVDYLLKGMEKNKSVGACCGRIHPIGSGPIIWYERFEYAVSHWLQKATEHVCGCVLCSPGCFTLLRGSAIVDENVLAVYSKDPKTPWQMIQFDQGEDRWLCTLLLKQGYRIEYCAAADAKTFAPEGFTEFFKQRRRWIPSTIANIIDILANFRYCAKKNNSISKLYLTYQAFLLCTAVITPASILLLMIGATVIAFDLAPWVAMILVILPTFVFTISIFAGTDKTQLLLASTISGIYATIMVVVLIGIFKSGIQAGICSETTIFICFVGGIFVVAAILHPREWMCILPGLMYFFAVPSASVILMIYAIGNIHITSWGTREGIDDKKQTGKEVDCSFGNVCRCILFPDEGSSSGSSPKFRTELRDCTLEEGKTLDLRADVTGYPKPKITWYLNNKKIHKSSKIKITFNVSTARLKIKDINVNYSGKYCCVAENEKGKDRLQVQVRVLGKSTKPFEPKFNGDLISRTVQNGSLILETDVTGFPTPKITWKKDGVEIQRDKYFKPRQCGSNVLLKIINAGELRGTITCFAKNEVAAKERDYDLGKPLTGSDKRITAPTIPTSPKEREYWENRKKHCLDSKKQKLGVKDQEVISTGLKDLRNKVFFSFLLINIVYFTFVVSLTQADSTLNQIAFEFPCLYADSVLRFNPIIIAFIGTFGVVLLIQFWGMIYHRMSTFVQIITSIQKETNVVNSESSQSSPSSAAGGVENNGQPSGCCFQQN